MKLTTVQTHSVCNKHIAMSLSWNMQQRGCTAKISLPISSHDNQCRPNICS